MERMCIFTPSTDVKSTFSAPPGLPCSTSHPQQEGRKNSEMGLTREGEMETAQRKSLGRRGDYFRPHQPWVRSKWNSSQSAERFLYLRISKAKSGGARLSKVTEGHGFQHPSPKHSPCKRSQGQQSYFATFALLGVLPDCLHSELFLSIHYPASHLFPSHIHRVLPIS